MACSMNPVYFINHHCRILSGDDWVPFRLWPAQVVVLKARQLGLSWLVVGYVLRLMLFKPIAQVLFFSKWDNEAVELVKERLRGCTPGSPYGSKRGRSTPTRRTRSRNGLGRSARSAPGTGLASPAIPESDR
jgi:hypothetical protein